MKNIFLIAAVLFRTAAYGQENNPFDILKHSERETQHVRNSPIEYHVIHSCWGGFPLLPIDFFKDKTAYKKPIRKVLLPGCGTIWPPTYYILANQILLPDGRVMDMKSHKLFRKSNLFPNTNPDPVQMIPSDKVKSFIAYSK